MVPISGGQLDMVTLDSGHPMGAAAALCNSDIIEREHLVENSHDVGQYLQQRMNATFADHPLVGESRGVGLLHGLEVFIG